MKKIYLLLFVVALVFIFAPRPALAIEGTATIAAQDLYDLGQRKKYRLGLRGCFISATDNINLNKEATFDFGLEFDAKMNENLDCGPRVGIVTKRLRTSAVNGTYFALRGGFGGRVYLIYWGESSTTHGLFNLYVNAEADYYFANKIADELAAGTSPSSFSGIGGFGGVGVEVAFGPNTGAFLEGGYQLSNLRSSGNQRLPLDGFVISGGARLAFF